MERIATALLLLVLLLTTACRPADKPADTTPVPDPTVVPQAASAETPLAAQPEPDHTEPDRAEPGQTNLGQTNVAQPDAMPEGPQAAAPAEAETSSPKYTAEQVAAARNLAEQLNARITTDAEAIPRPEGAVATVGMLMLRS
ncbi:MAG: hypothetical protein U1E05_03485, partial [Patescibacteria group bacterium]|nr:hypothetical protein [Patescibacteria group bacterium]